MTERARAVPLATLVCIVVALAAVRLREKSTARPSVFLAPAMGRRADAASPFVARAVVPSSPAGQEAIADGSVPALADAAIDAGGSVWHLVHGDPRHTGRASAAGPTRLKLAWTTRIGANRDGGASASSVEAQVTPSPDERTLYVASLDGSLTALDAATGAEAWTLALGGRSYATPCVSPAGMIYVGSDAKRFYAVTPKGTVAWKLETSGEADTGAAPAGDLVVFAAGASVFAVRAGGDVAWRFDAKKKVFTAPAVGPNGVLVFGSQDHRVYALSPAGALTWSTDVGADVDGAPAIGDDGAVTVGTDAGEVVRLSATGEVMWRSQVGGYVRGTLSLGRNGDALAGVYGPTPRVVRIGSDGRVSASFAVQGTGSREQGVHGAPLEDATGALFFGAQDDAVHALGPDGAWEWSFVTQGDVDAPLTLLSNGALVAASDDGNVYLFRP
jgi:outer membrane protein assembly factor BamB